ncbi:translocation/assembly module TamB domain-containing protein [Aureimonas mangrovi]|uniref:translocation/assembly module TamB domain-containing protein n=1 Tax=Aureimonas mangrovi TaxID=2758041 RepID=UPI00163DAA9B|nr:translocation/assembly module TamB domain-containing protein [Aureimonas mangrovi]
MMTLSRSLAPLALAAGFAVAPAAPANAQQFVANQIANLISSENAQVEITGLSGALSGALRIGEITVSDADGVYLTATDLAMDWSPLALARSNVSIENLSAGQITLTRLPGSAPADPDEPEAPSGGFSLPSITANIQQIAITEFVLGEAVAGTPARLSANASLSLTNDPTALDVSANIQRLDQPGEIALQLGFAPDDNRLVVEVNASEPAGGIVAGLLSLPDSPPVQLTITGNGPLNDFSAEGSLDIASERAITLSAQVSDSADGRRIAADISTITGPFVPEQYVDIVGETAEVDVAVLLGENGMIVIDQGRVVSGNLQLDAAGAYDPNGSANDLRVTLATAAGNPIPLGFGEGVSRAQLEISSLNATLRGALSSAAVEATTSLRTASFGDYAAQELNASLSTPGFDINSLRGPFAVSANIRSASAPEGVQSRFLQGPITLRAAGSLTENGIVLDENALSTAVANAAVTGNAALDFSTFDLALNTDFATTALSDATVPYAGERVTVAGNVARNAEGVLSANNLAVDGEGLQVRGSASLNGEEIAADIEGSLDQSANAQTGFTGRAAFDLAASGQLAAPQVDLTLTGADLLVSGRELTDLDARVQGTFAPDAPNGTIAVSGSYNQQPLRLTADFETLAEGERALRNLLIEQGENTVTGEVVLDTQNVPTGAVDIAAPDLSTLAALFGQDASGDLSGSANFSTGGDGAPVADVDLSSASLVAAGNTLAGLDVELRLTDYLLRPVAAGTLAAARLEAGTLLVEDLDVDLANLNDQTVIDAGVSVNAVPIAFVGDLQVIDTGVRLALRQLSAEIEDAAVSLDQPTTIVLGGGITNLGQIALSVGDGSLNASGTIGEGVDLDVALDAFPLAVANPFVEGLDADGFLTGTLDAAGSASNPRADFTLSGSAIATSQTRAAGLDALQLYVEGRYRNAVTTLEQATLDLGEGSIRATGDIGETLALDLALNAIPVSLANGFVDGLDAQGSISGTARATGRADNPVVIFDVDGTGITAAQIAASGIAPITLDVAGALRNGTVSFDNAVADIGDGEIRAVGSVGRNLNLQLDLADVPVGLANGFVDGLDASGTLSGNAAAMGSIANPQASFELAGANVSAAPLRQSGVETVALDLSGAYAEGTLNLRRAEIDAGSGRLSATGAVGQTLDLRLVLDNLPVALANAVVTDLGAQGTLTGNAIASGSLQAPTATFDVTADGISVAQTRAANVPALDAVARGSYENGTATIQTGTVQVGTGSLSVSGTVGELLDIDLIVNQLPLALADGFVPDLGAQGTLSGNVSASGPLANPAAEFDVNATGVSVAQARTFGAPPLNAVAAGSYANGTAQLANARIDLEGGGTVTATGTVGQQLNVDVTLAAIPASLASAVAPDIAPTGTIAGTVSATGSISNPSVTYDVGVTGLSVVQTRDVGVGPLNVSADGTYGNNAVNLNSLTLAGSGIDFSASGSVNVAGTPSFDLSLNGTAPLSIANRILAEGGRSVSGNVAVNAQVSGTAASPNVNGTISTAGAQFIDTGSNVVVNDITTTIALSGQTATFQSFSAQLGQGGTINVGGAVGFGDGFPANLTITADGARYADGELITTTVDAQLTLTGPLTGGPTLGGVINVREANILVPENLPSSLAQIDVRHVNAPPAVYRQQRELNPEQASPGGGGGGINLDLTLNAPNQVFVRGRGLDLEVGGSIRITGPSSNLAIVGAFELQRGRFQILSRRLDFERASLTFSGDLVPTLDIVAASDTGEATVRILITGPANNPSFAFTSSPALPQDEVLARLIFGQATTDLSPLQIAQLASAVATLTGVGGSSGLLDNLRSQLGVDDIDIRTTADGQAAVGVGSYLNENTYVGVDSTGRVSIDLELGANVKARAAVSATEGGGGEVGIFYEREY